jgi:hypothetical protein
VIDLLIGVHEHFRWAGMVIYPARLAEGNGLRRAGLGWASEL